MTLVGLVLAFAAGVVSFASPCCLPLVPAYVGYMVGVAPEGMAGRRMIALRQSLAFVLGFSVVFVALWASVGLVGYALRDQANLLRQIGGAILVFLGLHLAGIINVAALYREVRLPVGPFSGNAIGGAVLAGAGAGAGTGGATTIAVPSPSYARSTLLGVTFAAGWTPCIGPILGGIIGLASVSASVAEGSLLLIVFAAGLAVPFVLVAVGATSVSARLGWLRRHHELVSLVTGLLIVAVGFLMITNTFARLSQFVPFGL